MCFFFLLKLSTEPETRVCARSIIASVQCFYVCIKSNISIKSNAVNLCSLQYMTIILGELSREEDVLEWLVENKSTGDDEEVIEDVTAKTLNTLIGNIDSLAVLFCESPQITFCFFLIEQR